MSSSGFRILSFLVALALGGPSMADDGENHKKLAAMPRERRVALAENLDRFDKLEPAEQAQVRRLDAELSKKEPVEQARYRATLRTYHLWVVGLTDDQKKNLREARTAEEKFNLASKYRDEERAKALADGKDATSKSLPRVMKIRTGDYGMIGPYEAAHLLLVWQRLSPAQRTAFQKKPGRGELFRAIRLEGRNLKVFGPASHPEDIRVLADKFRADPEFDGLIGPSARKYNEVVKKAVADYDKKIKDLKKGEEPPMKHDLVPPRFEHDYAEFLYFAEHHPGPVLNSNLERFTAACPSWFLEMLDPLTSDDARDYLSIVYRLLYKSTGEMPEDSKSKPPIKSH